MDQQAKRAIKSLVLALRTRIEDDIAVQLKRYGFSGERWLPPEQLPHIQEDDHATIDHFRLKTALDQHLRRIGARPKKATPEQRAEAVDWFVREVAFTHLNRLVALKCLEVRDLIPEIITTSDSFGGRSRAHSDYRNSHPEEAAQPDDALPAAIRHTCRQVYTEFKFLFDVGDPAAGREAPANTILWPSYPVLKDCVSLMNGLDQEADNEDGTLWSEDEIIGWIYQFYNTEEKKAIRKRGRPRVAAEVAVINQFFTPRWIVKFLVDNTLGRLWLEMHPDSERVRAKCDYLVPEPLPQDENEAGKPGEQRFPLDPDSPINYSGAPPRRDPKRPQDIRLIDPACGTMHFGHYAFEVFQEIYRDARDMGWVNRGDALAHEEIPEAILRHNLYGVDIDLRAVQLAGLSLFVKAKTADPMAHISHVNLVVADAVLPADGARQRFLDEYKDDKVVQDAVRLVLEEMANVAEVGSLLRVEERLRGILVAAGHEAVQAWDLDRLLELPGFERPLRQLSLAENSGAVPEQWGVRYTLARLLADLRAFAADALHTHDLNAQLFAEEAEKTVHLLDVSLDSYDVVVMNPPYGVTTTKAKSLLESAFPVTKNDLYLAFIERATDLVSDGGLIGGLTSKTFMTLQRSHRFRREVLFGLTSLVALLDLSAGVLDDATVETTAFILEVPQREDSWAWFFDLRQSRDKKTAFEQLSKGMSRCALVLARPQASFADLPGAALLYYLPSSVERLFRSDPPLDLASFERAFGETEWSEQIAHVRQGLIPGNYAMFVRYRWEVPEGSIQKRWFTFAKGGDFVRYYADLEHVLLWGNDGRQIKAYAASRYGSASRTIKNEAYFFKEGLTYPRISSRGLNVRYFPSGHIFSDTGQAILPGDDRTDVFYLLGLLDSVLVLFIVEAIHPGRTHEVLHLAAIPYRHPSSQISNEISDLARQAFETKSSWDSGNSTCTRFDGPWIIQAHRRRLLAGFCDLHPSMPATNQLTTLLDHVCEAEQGADARLEEIQAQIDEAVYRLYEISGEDRVLIERELGDRPSELVWPQMEGKSVEEKRREHVRRLISYFLMEALKGTRDGVLPLSLGTGQSIAVDQIRRRMEAEFGEEASFGMEGDIQEILGDSIADWLDKGFFKWHIKLYKRRPIIWHLASPQNTFACLVYIHKLDRDTVRKVQTQYLWPARRTAQGELQAAKLETASRRIEQAESVLEDLEEFEGRLLSVIRGEVECDIPDWAEGPFRDGTYDPVLDDGVRVNITPLQEAGVLRYKKVV